jgi:hypothetical protein
MPAVVVRDGRTPAEVRGVIRDDRAISILVLAAGTSSEGPGPLVSAIARPATGAYPIPVTVVPGNLTEEEIDALA